MQHISSQSTSRIDETIGALQDAVRALESASDVLGESTYDNAAKTEWWHKARELRDSIVNELDRRDPALLVNVLKD